MSQKGELLGKGQLSGTFTVVCLSSLAPPESPFLGPNTSTQRALLSVCDHAFLSIRAVLSFGEEG